MGKWRTRYKPRILWSSIGWIGRSLTYVGFDCKRNVHLSSSFLVKDFRLFILLDLKFFCYVVLSLCLVPCLLWQIWKASSESPPSQEKQCEWQNRKCSRLNCISFSVKKKLFLFFLSTLSGSLFFGLTSFVKIIVTDKWQSIELEW